MDVKLYKHLGIDQIELEKSKKLFKINVRLCVVELELKGGKYDEVLRAGGDFPIIGRAIYRAEKPREYILNNILKRKEEK